MEAVSQRDESPRTDRRHSVRHLGDALDQVRKTKYARLTGNRRKFIKGKKYALLSHKENLNPEGKRSLKLLLKTNKRLNTAYLLRESFDHPLGLQLGRLGATVL